MGNSGQAGLRPKRHYGRRLTRQRALADKFNRRMPQPIRDDVPRPPRIHAYRCDSILVDASAQAAVEAATDRYVADLAAKHGIQQGESLLDGDAVWPLPLLDRPEGKRLDELLCVGDHVVLAGEMPCQGNKDLLTLLRAWQPRCVTVHVPTMKLSVATGSDEGKQVISVLEDFAALKFTERSAQRSATAARLRAQGYVSRGPIPPGWEIVGEEKGFKRLVPVSIEACMRVQAILDEIVRIRDELGWSWAKISDHVEAQLAESEGRPCVPRYGRKEWSRSRCRFQYQAEKRKRAAEAVEATRATS